MKIYRFIVIGKVQGVYYRKSVAKRLEPLGLDGYVKNLPDKSVEVVIKAPKKSLDTILEILKEGSEFSLVEEIKKEQLSEDIALDSGFKIRY